MKKLLTEWRKFLKESQEFVEEKSPLRYDRASNVMRLALRDDSIEPPTVVTLVLLTNILVVIPAQGG